MLTATELDQAQVPRPHVPAWLKERYGLIVSRASLDAWACGRGVGPVYRRISGRTYYPVEELQNWAEERLNGRLARKTEDHQQVA
jgi:hypothetical protein